MNAPWRILFVEDNLAEFHRVERHLRQHHWHAKLHRVASKSALAAALNRPDWDVVLTEEHLAGLGFEEILRLVEPRIEDLPLVLLARHLGEERAVSLLHQGVWNIAWKDNLSQLAPAIEHSLRDAAERLARRQSEGLLRESELQKSAVFDSMASHIAVLDPHGTILAVNAAWNHFTLSNTTSPARLHAACGVGANYFTVCRNSHGPGCEEAMAVHAGIEAVIQGRLPSFSLEYPCHAPTAKRWFLLTVTPLHHAGHGAVVSHLDITDRRLAEIALRDNEASFRAFFQTVDDPVFVAAAAGCLVWSNTAVETKLGYDSSEVSRLTVADLHPPDCRVEAGEILAAMFRGERKTCPLPLARKDGSTIPAETRAWTGQWDGQPCLFCVCKDLSAEQEAQQRFERLFRRNPLPMALSSLTDRRFVDANHSWLHTLGYEWADIVGKTAAELDLFPDPHALELYNAPQGDTGAVRDLELKVRARDGSLRDGLFSTEWLSSHGTPCLLTVMVDLTEQKQTQRLTQEREARYRALFDEAVDGILLTSTTGHDLRVNRAFARMHGFDSPEEMAGLRLSELDTPTSAPFAADRVRRTAAGENLTFEVEHYRKDGSTFPLSVTTTCVDLDGQPHVLAFHRDISAQKRAERLQALSTEVLRILNDPQALSQASRRILTAIQQATGLEAVGIRLRQGDDYPFAVAEGFPAEFIHEENTLALQTPPTREQPGGPADAPRLACTCGLVLQGNYDAAHSLLTPSGSCWTNNAFSLLSLPHGQDPRHAPRNRCLQQGYRSIALIPIRVDSQMVGLLQLNDRRRDCFTPDMIQFLEGIASSFGVALLRLREDQALREAEQKYRGIFEHAIEGIFLVSRDNTLVEANPALASLLGFPSPEVLLERARDFPALFLPDLLQHTLFEQHLDEEGFVREFEHQIQRLDGQWIWVTSNVRQVRDAAGHLDGYEGTTSEITARKQAEAALHERLELQDQLARVAASVPGLICSFRLQPDGTTSMPFATSALRDLYDLSPEEVRHDFTPILNRIHPDDRALIGQSIAESARTLSPWHDTFRIHHPARGERWIEGHSVPRRELDGSILWHGFVQDITERKRLEQEREAALIKYQTLFNAIPLGITVASPQGLILESNHVANQLLGLSADEQHERQIGSQAWHIVRPDGTPMPSSEFASVRALQEQRTVENVEMGLAKPGSAEITWINVTAAPVPLQDVGVVIAYTNITGRKRAEAALRESEDRYRTLVEESPDAIGIYQDDRLVFANSTAVRALGARTREELLGLASDAMIHPEDLPAARERIQRRLAGDTTAYPAEVRYRRLDGTVLPVEVSAAPVLFAGKPAMQFFARDITERRQAAEALAEREEIFSKIIGQAMDAIVVVDAATGQFIEFNTAAHERLGYTREEFSGFGIANIQAEHTADTIQRNLESVRQQGSASFETRHRHKDGSFRNALVSIRQLVIRNRDYMAAVWTDITEQRRAEARAARETLRTQFLLELHQRAPQMTDRELYDHVLERAVRLTESAIGFFHQVSEDQQTIILTTWNQEALKSCTAAFNTHYPLRAAGNWVDCVREQRPIIYNDYAHSPHQKGLPPGHTPVRRFMSIPVIRNGLVRIIFGVGNKPADYDDDDLEQLQIVANELHKLMVHRVTQSQLRQLSSAVEQSPVSILIANAQGMVEYTNPRFTQTTGKSPHQTHGQPLQHLLTSPTNPSRSEGFWNSILEGREWRGEIATVNPTGNPRWEFVSFSPITDPTGTVTHILGIQEDITERKLAMEAVRHSEERYRNLVETSSDWIWEVDQEARYTYASPKIQDILGFTPDEVLGRTPFDLMPPEEAKRVRTLFAEIARQGRPFHALENTNRHKDGRLIILETSGTPLCSAQGNLLGFRGTDRDVTVRKHLESQFRQAQKLEAIGQLAGGVAHDFNNILAAIMMQLELLREDSLLTPEGRESVKELEAEARRAASLTRQLLMFSRRSVLDIRVLNLNETVENLLKMLRRLIGERIQLQFLPAANLPTVEADSGVMEQVLMNLTVNARDAMPRGGCITIQTREETLDEAATQANPNRRPGHFVCLSVTDSGCGMAPATLRQIFEPFFTTKELGKGTGLGLATVHGIVGQHKGWIEVESEVDKGSTFRIYLPRTETGPDTAVTEAAVDLTALRGHETILVVEDESAVRRSLCQILRILGYRVLEAAEGQQALNIWHSEKQTIALLMTDMVMPGAMTGLELAEQLQAEMPALRVIISSGYSSEISQLGVPSDPRIQYMPKPFNARTLGIALRNALQRSPVPPNQP